jgi:hypothetical protein
MKIENILRTQAIVIGLGAALLLTSPAKSQEIVNTEFPDGPYVASFAQPMSTTAAASATAAPASTTTADTSAEAAAAVAIPAPVVTEEAAISLGNSAERLLVASSFFGLVMLAIYALAEVRRANRNSKYPSRSQLARPAALS